MNRFKAIIDCDPGHDDALAILWALASRRIDILGITTVAGNKSIDKVTENTLRLLTLAGRTDIPVAKGQPNPLMRNLIIGGDVVHGESGLDGPALPEKETDVIELGAVDFLIKTLEESEEKITLIPLGPLTNIAKLFLVRPDLMKKIERISLMGGGATHGNWTPFAEYNIFADPEAAKIVFNADLPIIMAGLDVTLKAYVTKEENEILREKGNKLGVFSAELIDFFSKFHYEVEGLPGCTLHDPTAIAALLYPEIFTGIQCNVDVETKGELTVGMTVVDRMNYLEKVQKKTVNKNTYVLMDVDREKYVEYFIEAMGSL
ncbi:nucleoside hydrolase [Proteiniclasticum ruminis]|uniref:nucleoside hydrolase n=1 Tax=Proteiniclasticum ruminis TaxID=398199 RepID=UPI0028AA3EC3|nr:nucleoside hydrolase [Proteiniclasticum ruminis]